MVLFALALTFPPGVVAGAARAERLIEEVVVTAAKREQGVYDVPASLSVFGGGELPERGIADLVDVGKFVPNLIVEQRTTGLEWESVWHVTDGFRLHATLGWLKVDVERRQGVRPVAPLSPELTLSLSPEYRLRLDNGAEIAARLDYSYRGRMWGEPSSDPRRLTRMGSRGMFNFHVGYGTPDGAWTVAVYARNATDERYDNARLNTGDYLLRILSNDAREVGVRVQRLLP